VQLTCFFTEELESQTKQQAMELGRARNETTDLAKDSLINAQIRYILEEFRRKPLRLFFL
jgi:hypothetical protein